MADLGERLRDIETATPPDLWADIAARGAEDAPTTQPTVVPFRRSVRSRRVAAALVAAAVFAAGALFAWEAFKPEPVGQPLNTLPAGWARCENGVLGYSIGHPGDWFTTDILIGTQDPSFACRWFSPEPFDIVDGEGRPQGNVVTEGWAYPMEIGIGEPLEQAVANRTDPEVARTVAQEELTVDGHRAVRLEYETLIDLIGEPGLHYVYLIELDAERTLVIHTTATRGVPGDYEENKRVLDLAVQTLSIADPLPGALPAGWQRCANERRMFEVGYPDDWYTTDISFGERMPERACTTFASVPFDLENEAGEPMGMVAEEGCIYPVCITFWPESLERMADAYSDPERVDVLAREEMVVNGRRTIRIDRVVLEPTLGEQEGASYHYLIELGPRSTVAIVTPQDDVTVGAGAQGPGSTQEVLRAEDYERNRAVLDEMVRTLILSPRT